MKAAVLHAANQPLTIEEVALNKPQSRARCCCAPPLPGCATAICISSRGSTRTRRRCVLGHEFAGDRRGGRRRRHLCQAGRPRHHLPLGVLRHLPAMRHRPSESVREHRRQDAARRRAPHDLEGRPADEPGLQPVVLRRADAGARERDGEDRPRHPARPRGTGRLRRDDRGRRGVQRRQGRAGRDGRGDRLRRGRAVGGQRRRARRRRAHHRDRHRRLEARTRARTRRHRHAQRQQRRPGQSGPRHDRRRRALLVRGARHQGDRRAGVSACCAPAAPRRSSAWCRLA